MNEASAREVMLLQTLEHAGSASAPAWTAQDGAWASRAALESAGPQGPADRFIAERAHHAMQRLGEREPSLAAWLQRRLWRARWWWWAAIAGLSMGLLADAAGSGRHINLLAPPVWGVVAWNLLVYALLLWSSLRALASRRRGRPGPLTALVQRWLAPRRLPGKVGILQQFSAAWTRHSAPLTAWRAAGLLHVAAAAVAAGLIAGLYARGLVLDYRAGWESTFLNATQVHAALSVLLAPALALSGMSLPDVATLDGLRLVPSGDANGANAAPWIHLYALSLALLVVLPRGLLALVSGLRSAVWARRFPLPLDDAYFQRLLRHRQGRAARVQVLPYAQAPAPFAEAGLRAVFGRVHGEAMQLQVSPVVAFGAEDDAAAVPRIPPATTVLVALFDLTATPEAENQGRFVERLAHAVVADAEAAPQPAVVMLVDEAAFVRRFGRASDRLMQRRAAWQALAGRLGTTAVFVDLSAPDVVGAETALQAALSGPASRAVAVVS